MSNKYSNYLSRCDLLNKYNSKSIYSIPSLDKVSVEFRLSDLPGLFGPGASDSEKTSSQTKLFCLFYLFFGVLPFISAQKVNRSSKKQRISEVEYSLKMRFSGTSPVNSFLFFLFVENWHNLEIEGFDLFNSKKMKERISSSSTGDSFVLNSEIPSGTFFVLDNILSKSLKAFGSKNFKFRVSFLFKNKSLRGNRLNNIRNIPLFWISG